MAGVDVMFDFLRSIYRRVFRKSIIRQNLKDLDHKSPAFRELLMQLGFGKKELRTTIVKPVLRAELGMNENDTIQTFKRKQVEELGYTLSDLWDAGFSPQELKNAGFTATELANQMARGSYFPYYTDMRAHLLKRAGFSAQELKDAGFGAKKLKGADCNATELKEAGFSDQELKEAGFTKRQLEATDLKEQGLNVQQLISAQFNLEDIRAAGFTGAELNVAGSSVQELKEAGFSAHELKVAGFSVQQLNVAGFSDQELKEAGFGAQELKVAGFSLKDLISAGFSALRLKWAGFGAQELKVAGFRGYHGHKLKEAGFSVEDLISDGFSAQELRDTRFSAQELKDAGFSNAQALKEVGFSARELKDAKFSFKEIKECGFSLKDLKNAGFSRKELGPMCKKPSDYIVVYTDQGKTLFNEEWLKVLYANDFTVSEIMDDIPLRSDLEEINYFQKTPEEREELKTISDHKETLGFTPQDILTIHKLSQKYRSLSRKTHPDKVQKTINRERDPKKKAKMKEDFDNKFKKISAANQFLNQTFHKEKDQVVKNVRKAKLFMDVGFTLRQLREGGFVNAGVLKSAGADLEGLIEAGFSPGELQTYYQPSEAGHRELFEKFSADVLRNNGMDATYFSEKNRFFAPDLHITAEQLYKKGFGAQELRVAGFSVQDLNKAGCPVKDIVDASDLIGERVFSLRLLRILRLSAKKLKEEAGCNPTELKEAGFTAKQLKEAGYTDKELEDDGRSAKGRSRAGSVVSAFQKAEAKAKVKAAARCNNQAATSKTRQGDSPISDID